MSAADSTTRRSCRGRTLVTVSTPASTAGLRPPDLGADTPRAASGTSIVDPPPAIATSHGWAIALNCNLRVAIGNADFVTPNDR